MKSFREHIESLPLAEQRALRAAERKWVESRNAGVAEDPANRDYEESFAGYEDRPAGSPEDRPGRLLPDPLDNS
jgi:hypothetical protein